MSDPDPPTPTLSAEGRAERVLVTIFLVARGAQLAFSTLMVLADRKRYTRPRLQYALLGASAVESAWLARRVLRASRQGDRVAVWSDIAFSSAGLLVGQAGLGPDSGGLWIKNIAIGAALGATALEDATEGNLAVGVLAAAAALSGVRARGRDRHVAGLALAVNDAISWAGMHGAARRFVHAHRRSARLLDQARGLAVERAGERAAESERARQHRVLHAVTAQVLAGLARSDDRAAAEAMARQEATRLRHALRTHGQPVTDLSEALQALIEELAESGRRVELVTSELDLDVGEPVSHALHAAVRAALAQPSPGRAVVRAAEDDAGGLVVTVRDPEADPPANSVREQLALELAAVGGAADVWSAPGRGSRITLRVPLESAVEGGRDQSGDRDPGGVVGHSPAGHHDRITGDDDVDRRPVGNGVGAPQGEIGGGVARAAGVAGDVDSGVGRQPLETRAQQRDPGDDPSTDRHLAHLHGSMVAAVTDRVRGRTTPITGGGEPDGGAERPGHSDEVARAERTIAAGLGTWRMTGLVTGAAALAFGWRRYRHPWVMVGLLAGTAGESAWIWWRFRRSVSWDDSTLALVDALGTSGALVAARANLTTADLPTFLNWVPWNVAASSVALQGIAAPGIRPAIRNAVPVLAAVAATQGPRPADAVANVGAMAFFCGGGRVFARQVRSVATSLQAATDRAMAEGARLAEERQRAAELRVLHDTALQALEAVGSGRLLDIAAIRARAAAEAERLERYVRGTDDARRRTLLSELVALADELAAAGLAVSVNVDAGLDAEPRPDVAVALRDACREALVNVQKHAGAGAATVRLAVADGGVEVTVADRGRGFDPASRPTGFGLDNSIVRRMTDVGGRAEVASAMGEGTTVRLWGPA